jgi:coatomer subunit beta
LTGLSDTIYAEATVLLNAFDITLEFLLVNRTAETLTNVSLELSALGDLKVTERPTTIVLGPREARRVKASLKVPLPFSVSLLYFGLG